MQTNRRVVTIRQPVNATEAPARQAKSAPIELSASELKQVAGGTPKGTWSAATTVSTPKGTW